MREAMWVCGREAPCCVCCGENTHTHTHKNDATPPHPHPTTPPHRPGIDEPFLEQWHQKLHTNTTPDDVTICEAYLAFMDTGDENTYNDTLWHRGRLTRADMAAWPRPVAATPFHMPHMKGAFEHYLRMLKSTHSGADLDAAADAASNSLPPDLVWHINDLRAHRGEWWAPGKVVEIREWLRPVWTAPGAPRDAALLDVALDAFLRTRVEADAANPDLSQSDRAGMVATLLRSAALDAPAGGDVAQCSALWSKLAADMTADGASVDPRLVLAAAQRTELAVAAAADAAVAAVQPAATAIGAAAGIDDVHVATFGEETARGMPLAAAGGLLAALAASARAAAGGGAWSVVASPTAGVAVGTVTVLASLGEAAGAAYPEGAILVCGTVDGSEDVPPGAAAVLTPTSIDALAHLALRARAQGTLLATAHEVEALEAVKKLAGTVATAAVAPGGDVVVTAGGVVATPGAGTAQPTTPLVLVKPPPPTAWVVTEPDYASSRGVGAKALNLATLRASLPAVTAAAKGVAVTIPSSVALPFGTLDRVLADPSNAATSATVKTLRAAVMKAAASPTGLPAAELAELRTVVSTTLTPPAGLRAALASAAAAAGVVPSGTWASDADASWTAAWGAICGVWASAWTDRAWLARRAARVPDADLSMSVLVQAVAPADHAFVLHSADPTAAGGADAATVYGEVVAGAGEALVSAAPGRAAAFRARKAPPTTIATLTLPSKRCVWRTPPGGAVIFRSDSNGEDLADFSGAGLHDSLCVPPLTLSTTDLASEPLAWDPSARDALFGSLAAVGAAVETAAGGGPQDVEGCVVGGGVVIVQARPQVV